MEKNNQQKNVLINALTLNIGGGIQIGKGFVEYCANKKFKNLKLHFLLSRELYNSINKKLLKKIKTLNLFVCFKVQSKRIFLTITDRDLSLKRLNRFVT